MHRRQLKIVFSTLALVVLSVFARGAIASAVTNPQSGSVGLQGTIQGPPPTEPATILQPSSGGTSISTTNVTGTCPDGTLVKVFSNGILVGSAECSGGHFSVEVSLFSGTNDLTALDYDALDQSGPTSPTVTVNFITSQFSGLGPLLFISSDYAERGANPGDVLSWPITLNGGTGPYALSIDWGDGQPSQLLSEQFSGLVTLSHTYTNAGTYTVIIRATDKNGETAYFQVIAVANGAVAQSGTTKGSSSNTTTTKTVIIWWPVAVCIPLLLITFWLGRRYELGALRKRIESQERA